MYEVIIRLIVAEFDLEWIVVYGGVVLEASGIIIHHWK